MSSVLGFTGEQLALRGIDQDRMERKCTSLLSITFYFMRQGTDREGWGVGWDEID
jgi:hypothetical protein